MLYYAGIGMRKTPQECLTYMTGLAKVLAKRSYILRSGGADGADSAFESGCDDVKGNKEIFLPWKAFNNNPSLLYDATLSNWDEAMKIAASIHPAWSILTISEQKFHIRNVYQIQGQDLHTLVDFVICYTNGVGGTMQSVRLAKKHNIPVFNLKMDRRISKIDPEDYVNYVLNRTKELQE